MTIKTVDFDEPPLQRWLGSVVSTGTKYCYRTAYSAYHTYTSLNSVQLIDEAYEDSKKDVREQKDIVLTRLIGFYNWLKTEYEVKSRGSSKIKEHKVVKKGGSDKLADLYVAAIRSFYATYNIFVKLKGRHRLPKPRVENKRMVVGAEQVKALVDHARTPRDKAIILVNFQSGMDVSTLCSLLYCDISKGLKENEHPLKLEPYRQKTGVDYYTFLGQDTCDALRVYIKDAESRGMRFEEKSPLFVTEKGKEPVETNNVQTMLKEVAVRAGLVSEQNNGNSFNPLGPHSLRESFSSIMTNSGVPDTIVDFWLGHEIGEMAKAYKTTQFESLKKMYLDREKLLSISRSPIDSEELEKKVDERIQSLQRVINNYSTENFVLNEKVEALGEEIKSIRSFIKENYDPLLNRLDLLGEDGLKVLSEIVTERLEEKRDRQRVEEYNKPLSPEEKGS